ncbi:MAG: glutathione S-transferase family protein [Hyphomicrobiaceae bacterium]
MTIRVWGRPTSARTQKVLFALAELGLQADLVLASATMGAGGHVSKGNAAFGIVDTAAYRAMNPNGTVPTIDDDGFVLWESNAIVQYLGMRHGPELFYGNDIRLFASASRWMMWENNQLIPPMHELVMQLIRLPADKRDPAKAEAARQRLARELTIVDGVLAGSRYIAGERWTMGDIPLAIRVHRWHLLDIERPALPHIARYYDDLRARPAFAAIADPAMHVEG